MGDFNSEFFPLVNQPDSKNFIRLIDATIVEFHGEIGMTGFLQQTLCFGPVFGHIFSVSCQLDQFILGCRQGMIWEDHTTDGFDDCDLGEVFGTTPAVDSQGQGASHPWIIKRLTLLVECGKKDTIPVTFLDGDFVS